MGLQKESLDNSSSYGQGNVTKLNYGEDSWSRTNDVSYVTDLQSAATQPTVALSPNGRKGKNRTCVSRLSVDRSTIELHSEKMPIVKFCLTLQSET